MTPEQQQLLLQISQAMAEAAWEKLLAYREAGNSLDVLLDAATKENDRSIYDVLKPDLRG
jgi:hypothetical protein